MMCTNVLRRPEKVPCPPANTEILEFIRLLAECIKKVFNGRTKYGCENLGRPDVDRVNYFCVYKYFAIKLKWLCSPTKRDHLYVCLCFCLYLSIYTGCNRRNGPNFGRVFLMLNYTDITQNTYIQSFTVPKIMAIKKCGLLWGRRTVSLAWCHTRPLRFPNNGP
jgi:hypothetical protein